jgi:hypothetical protein
MNLQFTSFGTGKIRVSVRVQTMENYAINGNGEAIGEPNWKYKGGHTLSFIVNGNDWLWGGDEVTKPKIVALIASWCNENFRFYLIETEDDVPYSYGGWYTYETEPSMDITDFIASNEVEWLMSNEEILTESERDKVVAYNPEFARMFLHNVGGGRFLNTNVYSEHEHHERQFRMETGL